MNKSFFASSLETILQIAITLTFALGGHSSVHAQGVLTSFVEGFEAAIAAIASVVTSR
jgi:hypothetical protein